MPQRRRRDRRLRDSQSTCRCTPEDRDSGAVVALGRPTHTAYSSPKRFIDELAAAAGKDPVEFRKALLPGHPRHRAALDLAADQGGWGKPLPGQGREKRGAASRSMHRSAACARRSPRSRSTAASSASTGSICAVRLRDRRQSGRDRARQMEGGIVFGLSAALDGAITLKDGEVEQSNFHDYPLLRIGEMPKIDVHIVPSSDSRRESASRASADRAGGRQRAVRGDRKALAQLAVQARVGGGRLLCTRRSASRLRT